MCYSPRSTRIRTTIPPEAGGTVRVESKIPVATMLVFLMMILTSSLYRSLEREKRQMP